MLGFPPQVGQIGPLCGNASNCSGCDRPSIWVCNFTYVQSYSDVKDPSLSFSRWDLLDESHISSPTHMPPTWAELNSGTHQGTKRYCNTEYIRKTLVDNKVRAVCRTLFILWFVPWIPSRPSFASLCLRSLKLFGLAEQPRNPLSQREKPCESSPHSGFQSMPISVRF